MADVTSWVATAILVASVVAFLAHLPPTFRQPPVRPRVRRRDRYGAVVGRDRNTGPEINPGP